MARSGDDVLYGANFACQAPSLEVDLAVNLVENGQKVRDAFVQTFYSRSFGSASQQVFGSFPRCFSAYSYVTGRTSGGTDFVSQPILTDNCCYR